MVTVQEPEVSKGAFLGPAYGICVGLVAGRCGDPDVGSDLGSREHQRMGNVVSITDERDLYASKPALHLENGEKIGHGLAGMAVVGEAVDDRDAGVFSHLRHDFVGEGADHDALYHALQVLGHVIDRFALAQVDLRWGEIQRKSA